MKGINQLIEKQKPQKNWIEFLFELLMIPQGISV